LSETEAPDGTDVIDRVPTNLGRRVVVGADSRSSDRGCGTEITLSRGDRGVFAITAVADVARIPSFVAGTTGAEI
jgi:hypothetical protein